MQELLQQAGYKDTRVYTPEAEKIRQIKKTFEEDEAEELNDLYGTLGLKRGVGAGNTREHRIQNVTEPTIPFRSSSAVLRDLALQDMKMHDKEAIPSSPVEPSSWWEGGMAAIGRAAKAVIEVSPPPRRGMLDADPEVIDGMAVRKVKSNMELTSGARMMSSTTSQEQRAPPRVSPDSPLEDVVGNITGSASCQAPRTNDSGGFRLPPPPALDDEAFGYSPLPNGYEAQIDDDTGVFDLHSFDRDTDESSDTRQDSVEVDEEDFTEVQAVENDLDLCTSARSSTSYDAEFDLGRRILAGAQEYDDDLDSPPMASIPLPDIDDMIPCDVGPPETPLKNASASAASVAPTLKYADRATKLRIAKSTPVLRQEPSPISWFDSLRQALVGPFASHAAVNIATPVAQSHANALRVIPASRAAPTLLTRSNVLCDSTSAGATDLPPVAARPNSSSSIASSIPLRLRPSIARLRNAVYAAPVTDHEVDPTLTLSPRLDWDSQGQDYAGWNWSTKKQRPARTLEHIEPSSPPVTSSNPDGVIKGSIDYTKSFFYKPATPPRKPSANGARPSNERIASEPQLRTRRSIKSLKAALMLPVAPPPVPSIPSQYSRLVPGVNDTPPRQSAELRLEPPALAIQSPGSWEAGLPPRALVLEGEEWDAKDGKVPGDWGKKASKKGSTKKLKKKSAPGDR